MLTFLLESLDKPLAKIAIITRTKDRPTLLARALDSVLSQVETDWVHVIVNDGGNKEVVEKLTSERENLYNRRLKLIHHSKSLGMEAASNAGIKAVDSKYILIHDDDDTLLPDFLSKTSEYLDNPKTSTTRGVVTWVERVDEEVDPKAGKVKVINREIFETFYGVNIASIANKNLFPPISFLFSRDSWEQLGGFDEKLPVRGDWEFNLRFLTQYDIDVIPEVLAGYHHRLPSGDSNSYANTVVAKQAQHEFFRSYIINRELRNDFEAGKLGLGTILGIVNELGTDKSLLEQISRDTNYTRTHLNRLANLPVLKQLRKLTSSR